MVHRSATRRATPIVDRACANVKCQQSDPDYDKQLICAIYAERGRRKPDGNLAYSEEFASVQAGVAKRFRTKSRTRWQCWRRKPDQLHAQ